MIIGNHLRRAPCGSFRQMVPDPLSVTDWVTADWLRVFGTRDVCQAF